jgi:hypothetical protein
MAMALVITVAVAVRDTACDTALTVKRTVESVNNAMKSRVRSLKAGWTPSYIATV